MFDTIIAAPSDPILGLTEAFNSDTRPGKINLGVGVYQDHNGHTPIFEAVASARRQVLEDETSKSYLPIDGSPSYGRQVQQLLLGQDHPILASGRLVTAQAPGGTGALRVAGDCFHQLFPAASIWLSEPTWANHPKIFQAAGLQVQTYPYFDKSSNSLDINGMLKALEQIPSGDLVLLHGCCHNPSGVDPTPQEWGQIAEIVVRRKLVPLVDFAYQGLGDGLEADAIGLRTLCEADTELFVASSFSKNFGLYNERVGALSAIAATPDAAQRLLSHIKTSIRANYSNPPAHGAAIVQTVLANQTLRNLWTTEVAAMRDRINGMRTLMVETLRAKGVSADFSFIVRQRGMFSFSGLSKDQVQRLRQDYGIYIVDSGRINVAGITPKNVGALCRAMAAVL